MRDQMLTFLHVRDHARVNVFTRERTVIIVCDRMCDYTVVTATSFMGYWEPTHYLQQNSE